MSWNNKEEIETTCSTVQQWRYLFVFSYRLDKEYRIAVFNKKYIDIFQCIKYGGYWIHKFFSYDMENIPNSLHTKTWKN